MKISIIIPAYNSEHCIISTLESVRNQTLLPFEILITNDGSTDNTESIVMQYAAKHTDLPISIFSQKNKGIGAARNRGLFHAKGDIIAFLDADDFWYPTKLERICHIFQNQPEVDVVYHAICEVTYKGRKRVTRYRNIVGDPYKFLLLNGNQLMTSATTVKRSTALQVGGFSKDMSFNSAEDFDLWLRLSRKGAAFFYLNEILSEYRRFPSSITGKLDHHGTNVYNVLAHHLRTLKEMGQIDEREYVNLLFYQAQIRNYKIMKELVRRNELTSSIKFAATNIKSWPARLRTYLFVIRFFLKNRITAAKLKR